MQGACVDCADCVEVVCLAEVAYVAEVVALARLIWPADCAESLFVADPLVVFGVVGCVGDVVSVFIVFVCGIICDDVAVVHCILCLVSCNLI